MASHRWWKSIWYGLLFFSCFDIVVRAFSCPRLHNAFCRHQNKKRRNKNTFKERVKFPILECTVEIRETKHSRIVVELSGWLSLPWYTSSTPGVWCHCGLRQVSLVPEKPMKIWLLLFFFFCVFCMKRLWRHQCRIKYPCQMCSPQTWAGFHRSSHRGRCGASFIELLRHAILPWYPGASVSGSFTVPQIPGGFCMRGGEAALTSPLPPLSSASPHPHYWTLLSSWNKDSEDVNVIRIELNVNAQYHSCIYKINEYCNKD